MTTVRILRMAISVAIVFPMFLAACGSDTTATGEVRPVTDADFAPEWMLSEFRIEGDLVIAAGEIVASVSNEGVVEHNVGIDEVGFSSILAAGEEEAFALGALGAGEYVLYCNIDGHRAAGMEATLTVLAVEGGEIVIPDDLG